MTTLARLHRPGRAGRPRAARRARRLQAQRRLEPGARRRETGRGHYPVMVVLHTGLLVGALVEAWVRRPDVPAVLAWSMLALVLASQALRWWCIATLGRRWNTRVIVVPGLAPVRSRSLPPVLATPTTSRSSSRASRCRWCTPPGSPRSSSRVANAVLLTVRIRVENAALAHAAGVRRADLSVRDLVVAGGGPGRPGHRAVRRPRRARRRGPRAAPRPDRQGLRRGADAGGRGRPRRLGVCPEGRPIAGIRYVDGEPRPRRDVPARPRPRRPPYDAARGAVRRRWPRPGSPSSRSRWAPSRSAATTCSSTASRPATSSPPTGCTRRCAGWLGLDGPARGPPPVRAPRATSRSRRGRPSSRCTGRRPAEAYVTPVADGWSASRCSAARSAAFDELLGEHPAPVRAARGRCRAPGSAAPGRCGSAPPRRVAGRVLLVGDAAGYVDALTGEGIALGLAQARAAVDAFAPGAPERLRAGVAAARVAARPAHPRAARGDPAAPCCAAGSCPPRPGSRGCSAPPSTSWRGPA